MREWRAPCFTEWTLGADSHCEIPIALNELAATDRPKGCSTGPAVILCATAAALAICEFLAKICSMQRIGSSANDRSVACQVMHSSSHIAGWREYLGRMPPRTATAHIAAVRQKPGCEEIHLSRHTQGPCSRVTPSIRCAESESSAASKTEVEHVYNTPSGVPMMDGR